MFTTTYLASGWYEQFLKWIPEGEIFNLRVVFEAIPGILKELPNTILLTLAGAFFGLLLALLFAIVKINRVKILYPIQALFVSFLRGTPILVQLMLTYYGIPLLLKAINQQYGTTFNINDVPAHLLLWPLPLMRQPMPVRPFGQRFCLLMRVKLKRRRVSG